MLKDNIDSSIEFLNVCPARKPVRFYLPDGHDPADCLPDSLARFKDHARYLVSTIYHRRIFDRRADDDYLYLHSTLLKRVMGTNYKVVRDALKDAGIIEMNRQYTKGEHSMGYRLNHDLRHRRHRIHTATDLGLTTRLDTYRQSTAPTFDVHKYLYEKLQQVKIDFSSAAASDCPEAVANAEMIHNQDWHFTVCQYGRVHSNLSNLKSDFRKHLSVNGLRLVNVDIRNSQPLFFGVILLNWFTQKGHLDSVYSFSFDSIKENLYYDFPTSFFANSWNFNKSLYNQDSSNTTKPIPNLPSIPYVSGLITLPKDVEVYLSLVQEGKLYEYLMEEAKIPLDQRKEYKKSFFGRVFFCKNSSPYAEKEDFKRIFPNVFDVITKLKERDYTQLPKLLQKVESSLIVNRVVRRIMEGNPDAWVNTIHDSILTTADQAEEVVRIIKSEFVRFGLVPSLKIERY